MKTTAGEEGLLNLLKLTFEGVNELSKNPLLQVSQHCMRGSIHSASLYLCFYSSYHLLVESMQLPCARFELLADTVLS